MSNEPAWATAEEIDAAIPETEWTPEDEVKAQAIGAVVGEIDREFFRSAGSGSRQDEHRARVKALRAIVTDLAEDDPIASARYGPYCRYCGQAYGVIDLSQHVPGCVWQRAREITTKVASR